MNSEIEPLLPLHRRSEFNCGNLILDRYFQTQVGQDVKKLVCTCFILADPNHYVKGYYTLSSAAIPRAAVPLEVQKKLPLYKDLPVTLLGRLAIDKKFHKQGLGELLLIDALKRSYEASLKTIGSLAVIVDPIDEAAKFFYDRYGFIPLPDSKKMLLSMKTIEKLF
jgi:GNAT superfamily N-acetyltransferase